MDFMGKDLGKIEVSLPLADGTEMECKVYAYFVVNETGYFALLPVNEEKEMDFSQSYMLYRVEEDEEHNPIVLYIEDDYEYALAAKYFSENILISTQTS